MDQKKAFEDQNESFKFCEMIQNNQHNDIVDKFRAYRLNAEATAVKLKEANSVIDHLKTEIDISREVETNLRSQIISAENRLIYLQKTNTKILKISDRLRQSEGISLEIERKIINIKEEIHKIKEQSQNAIDIISNEINLMKKCEKLKLDLKNKENEANLIKKENQILAKQKEEIEIQIEQKFKLLESNAEELKREIMENRALYNQNVEVYRKEIEEQKLTLKKYERERKSLLEDFAMPEKPEASSWADSALLFSEKRSPKNSKPAKRSMASEFNGMKEHFPTSSTSRRNLSFNYKNPKPLSLKPKKGYKGKPQLEFLISDSSQTTSSDTPPPKRRLFSQNCNHYIN